DAVNFRGAIIVKRGRRINPKPRLFGNMQETWSDKAWAGAEAGPCLGLIRPYTSKSASRLHDALAGLGATVGFEQVQLITARAGCQHHTFAHPELHLAWLEVGDHDS